MVRSFALVLLTGFFYQSFSQPSYQLNGNAIATGSDCYQITAAVGNQVGTVWYTDLLNLNQPFEINFEMNFGASDAGADGMVFGLQTVGPFAAGVGGGGIGFTGFSPSLGIEFDTYYNSGFGDIVNDHVAIMQNGSGTHTSTDNLAGPVQASSTLPNIEDNTEHYIRITWNPATDSLNVYFDCVWRVGIQNDIINTIFGGQNMVYWGFTGSTGGAFNTQTVCLSENIFPVTYTFEICPGESLELSPYILNGTNYNWTPAAGLSATNIPNPIATPATDTQYIVTFLDACGQLKSDTVNIDVIESAPIITFNQNTFTACPDDNVNIVATVTDNFGPVTYSWSPAAPATNNITVSPDVLTWYYLTATDDCTSSIDSVKIEIGVVDLTDIDVVNATNCPGQPGLPGEIEIFPDDPGWTYTLTNGATVIGPQVSNQFTGLAGGINYFIHVEDANGCAIDTIVFVGLGSNPVIATWLPASLQDVTCFGDNDGAAAISNISGGLSAPYTITWTNTSGLFDQTSVGVGGGDSQTNLPGGNWVVTVSDDEGCAWSQVFTIDEPSEITLDFTSNEPNCYQFSDGSVTINTAGGNGGNIFVISNSLGGAPLNAGNSNTVNQLGTGWYYATITDNMGCSVLDSIFLDQPGQLDIDLQVTQPACYGDSTGFAFIDTVYNYTGDYQDISYFWAPKPQGGNGIGNLFSAGLYEGTYTITINDENGCSRIFDFAIAYPPALIFTEIGYEPAYCRLFSYQSGNGVVYAAGGGGTPDYSYEWLNLQTGQTSSNTTWGGLNPGNYQMTLTDDNGCTLIQIVTVDSLNPVADFEMTSPQFTTNYEGTAIVDVHFVNQSLYYANPNDPTADTTFFWNFGYNIPWQISHDVAETFDTTYYVGGTYNVCLVALNKNGCSDTLCKPVIVYDPLVFTPLNIFTPDGDGVNDLFSFNYRSEAVASFECVIVDRWGVVMFEMDDIADSWDGKDKNGSPCTNGVYFYTYEGAAENGTPFKGQGTIQIIGE